MSKPFNVYRDYITDNVPIQLSRILGTKKAVTAYLRDKLGSDFDEGRLERTQYGYKYEIRAFSFYRFSREFT